MAYFGEINPLCHLQSLGQVFSPLQFSTKENGLSEAAGFFLLDLIKETKLERDWS